MNEEIKDRKPSGEETPKGNGDKPKEGKPRRQNFKRYIHEQNAAIWYGSENAGIKSAANFSTAIVAGQANSIGLKVPNIFGDTAPTKGVDCTRATAPLGAIMTLALDSTVPVTSAYNWTEHASSFNAAVLKLYNIMRGNKVSTTPFDSVDLGIYLVSIAEIFKVMRTIQRAMIYMDTIIPNTRYSPQLLYRALTGSSNYDVEKKAFANYQTRFVKDTNLLYALQFPKVGTILDKADWIYDYVYCDDVDLEKANLYAYVPHSVLKYEGYTTKTGGRLTRVSTPFSKSNPTLDDWFELYESLIAAMLDDNGVRDISAWIKANGYPTMTQGQIKPEALGKPIFNEEVLEQMMNAQVTNHVSEHYVQYNNLLVGETSGAAVDKATIGKPFIELSAFTDLIFDSKSNIAYERTLTSTRLVPIIKKCQNYQGVTVTGENVTLGQPGTYYTVMTDFYALNAFNILWIDGDGTVHNSNNLSTMGFENAITHATDEFNIVTPYREGIEDIWEGFEYRPAVTIVAYTGTVNAGILKSIDSIESVRRYGNWDYVMLMDYDALARLNDLIVSAELGLA